MTVAYLTHSSFSAHDWPRHPEHAGRIQAVWQKMAEQGLSDQLWQVTPQPASDAQILAVHSTAQLQRLLALAQSEGLSLIDQDTYALPLSLGVARRAAGAVIGAIDAIASKQATQAIAAVRPPGHHATIERQMGFCLLNNIAIGARYAQTQQQFKKVLIFDYDVHHGNGTQDIFYADPTVLFISIHQSPFYPGSGALHETGAGAGQGYTLNMPIPGGYGDAAYRQIFTQVVAPAVERFQPDLMLISAGFDAHWVDPLANMQLSLAGYDYLARACLGLAQRLCGGRIVFVMEGGYDLKALAAGWSNIARALLGLDGLSDPYGPPAATRKRDISALIRQARDMHRL